MAKVLIVDDEKSIRATLAEFVREDGHDVQTAETAKEALELIRAEVPDVLVTDIVLPQMSGVDLLARVHAEHPETQIIMITGEPTVETAAEAVRQGAFDYLSKPVSSQAIRAAVTRSARVKELADDRRRLEVENLRYREHLEEEIERRGRALRESEERHRAVVENAVEGIAVVQDDLIRFANPSAVTIAGYPHDVLLTQPFLQRVHPDDVGRIRDRQVRRLLGEEAPEVYTFRFQRGDGQWRCLELRPVAFEWDDRPATLNFVRDITDEQAVRHREEARLRRVESYSSSLVGLAMHPALYLGDLDAALRVIAETVAEVVDVERVEVWLSEEEGDDGTCVELFERTPRRHSSGRKPSLTVHPAYTAALRAERSIAAADAQHDPRTAEYAQAYFAPHGIGAVIDVALRLGGRVIGIFSVEHVGSTRPWHDEDVEFANAVAGLVAVAVEAAKRSEIEHALERSEAEFRSLFEDSPVSLIVQDFSEVKRTFDELRRAGVADLASYFDDHPEAVVDLTRLISIAEANSAAIQFHEASSKEDLVHRMADVIPPGSLPHLRDRFVALWRGERTHRATSEDVTLKGRPAHVDVRWTVPLGQEETLTRVLMSKMDITSLVEGERRVRRALDGAIEAIGRVTEARDPYTAGHQRRVTALAVAIAERLGWDGVRVEATRASGLLHDIGKLSIPAEILAKPSALSTLEMLLMKTHPQSAYDVLKTIEFPWPVADIVVQHHEREDGSGYPHGLRGDAILAEARVLAVADVVEAMSSHRPYRAALGIGAALEEIERGRGTLYDIDAVDVCLELFRLEGFSFPTTQEERTHATKNGRWSPGRRRT